MWFTSLETSWGLFSYVAQDDRLLATYLPSPTDSRESVARQIRQAWPDAEQRARGIKHFDRDIRAYFAGKPVDFDIELDLSCWPAFSQRVLQTCRRIPHGSFATYGELARQTGHAGAARAVGNVMARNPLPLVIPCHRVLRSGGQLGGFSGPAGVTLKARMLELERNAHAPPATAPARACG